MAARKPAKPRLPSDIAVWYAESVKKGRTPAPDAVKKACDRYLYLIKGSEFDYDPDNIDARCELISMLDTPESISADTQGLVLLPYQCLVLGFVYGLLEKKTGYRAIRKVLLLVPRKAGKSTLAGGMMALEGAQPVGGAQNIEILSAGVNLETAGHSFGKMVKMLNTDMKKNTGFCEMFEAKVLKEEVHFGKSGATIKRATTGGRSLEGWTATCIFFDEISRLPDPTSIETLYSGLGHTPHRLLFCTSTYSDLPESALDHEVETTLNMLHSPTKKIRSIGLLYSAGVEDDWRSVKTWRKVQPRLDDPTGDLLEHYREVSEKAKFDEITREGFLLRALNVPFGGGTKWINQLEYDSIERIPPEEMWPPPKAHESKHYLGVDLGDSRDSTVLCLLSIDKDDCWSLRFKIFYPDGSGEWVDEADFKIATLFSGGINKKYMRMAKKGHATICSGPLINHKMIAEQIIAISKMVKLSGLYSDPWLSLEEVRKHLPIDLNGLLIQVPKNQGTQSPAIRALEPRIKIGGLKIDPNPIVRDHFTNAIAKHSEQGGIVLRKATETSLAHIDSADAALIAIIGRAYVNSKENLIGTPARPIENLPLSKFDISDYVLEI